MKWNYMYRNVAVFVLYSEKTEWIKNKIEKGYGYAYERKPFSPVKLRESIDKNISINMSKQK